ncbi:MAG: flagellar hook protein FlgE [Firmicutes bacterium]|nr:flagellar hook protein FlgE [Bacillota bacterium]
MMRSMFAGVSGTRSHQLRMDVIGNNIANVNTVGFKYGRVTFQDALSQTLRGAVAPKEGVKGGINLMQVGLGVMTRAIDTVFTQGNMEGTGKLTDMAIQGNGFFVVRNSAGSLLFTRDGAFSIDAGGQLTHPSTGFRVQGWMANSSGSIDTSQPLQALSIPLGQSMTARATAKVGFVGNLDAEATDGGTWATAVPIYDSLGVQHSITVTYTKQASPPDNTWAWSAEFGDPATTIGSGTVTFTPEGRVDSVVGTTISFNPGNGAAPVSIEVDFAALTQYGQGSSVNWSYQDGFPAGSLETFNIDDTGVITGVYSNGQYEVLGQIAVASFANPEGLSRASANMFAETTNSGNPQLGVATQGGRGSILGATLEMSNVDLAREFTDMIITQRGFQANSRMITTADEMLQDLLALRR